MLHGRRLLPRAVPIGEFFLSPAEPFGSDWALPKSQLPRENRPASNPGVRAAPGPRRAGAAGLE